MLTDFVNIIKDVLFNMDSWQKPESLFPAELMAGVFISQAPRLG